MTRSKAVERREQREIEKRNQQRRLIVIGIVGLVITLVLLVLLVNIPAEAPIPEGNAERFAGLSQSRTEKGYSRLGDPATSVTVTIFSSFASSNARDFYDRTIDGLIERVRAGSIQVISVPMFLGNTDGSQLTNGRGAARAAICATEQGKFWELQNVFFAWHEQFANQAYSNNRIVGAIGALGIDRGLYDACLASSRPSDTLAESQSDAEGLLNFSGMPTIAINGAVPLNEENQPITDAETLFARIDEAVQNASAAASVTPEPTPEVTEEAATEATAEPTIEPTAEPTAEPTSTAAPSATPGS